LGHACPSLSPGVTLPLGNFKKIREVTKMQVCSLNIGDMSKIMRMKESSFRPPEIVNLKKEIEGAIRVAELHASITGKIDREEIKKIVIMRLKLDQLYGEWALEATKESP
jgi:hypothetical protein